MLRITIQQAEDGVVMKLEGCLAGPWVHELEACWCQARTADGGRVRIDLRSVCHVDAAGRDLMTRMHRAGAAFVASGCVMPEVVREVTETPGGDRSPQERTWRERT